MIFPKSIIKSARIDMVTGNATITFEMTLTQNVLDQRGRLSWLSSNKDEVELIVTSNERQLPLIAGDISATEPSE
jgi:hypothetical protein